MNTLEKLKCLGLAASYDSCGGGKEKSFRDYGIPYEYQSFIHNCTQSTENVFVRRAIEGNKLVKGKKLYEKNIYSQEEKNLVKNKMRALSPVTENKKLNKANKCLLVKILQNNTCVHDCSYCVNTSCKNKTRASLEPIEVANSFEYLYKKGFTTGLFLSSAVCVSPENTTEKMIASAKILRERGYKGYIHMKVLPETPKYLVKEMALYANRLSVNIESATIQGFEELTSTKNYKSGLLKEINFLDSIKKESDKQTNLNSNWFRESINHDEENYRFKSFTTQIIVGANYETDKDILDRMDSLYEETSLYRTYFSAFSPVEGTKLEKQQSENKKREHRLYEVDFLMRQYGFKKNLIKKGLTETNNFSLGVDVKQSIACSMQELFPLDPNSATREELLLVPGIGLKSVEKILEIRENKKINEINDLVKEGIRVKKAQTFLSTNGKQTKLFSF